MKKTTSYTSLMTLLCVGLALGAGACEPEVRDPGPPPPVASAIPIARSAPGVEIDRVTAFAVDAAGTMYVGNRDEILVLSAQGEPITKLGRGGGGPGEFAYVSNVAVLPGDSLYVYDSDAQRVTVYAPGMRKVAYTTHLFTPEVSNAYWAMPAGRERGGGRILAAYKTAQGDVPGRERGGSLPEVVRLLNADASLSRDSVVVMREAQSLAINSSEGRGYLIYPFARRSMLALGPDGTIYQGWTDSLRFSWQSPDGRSGTIIAPHEGEPITARQIDSIADGLLGNTFSKPTLLRALEATGTRTWPAFRAMVVDDHQRLWVALTPAPGTTDNEWAVFDRSGARSGTLRLPASEWIATVRGDRAYAIASDSLDVQSVVVYKLSPATAVAGAR